MAHDGCGATSGAGFFPYGDGEWSTCACFMAHDGCAGATKGAGVCPYDDGEWSASVCSQPDSHPGVCICFPPNSRPLLTSCMPSKSRTLRTSRICLAVKTIDRRRERYFSRVAPGLRWPGRKRQEREEGTGRQQVDASSALRSPGSREARMPNSVTQAAQQCCAMEAKHCHVRFPLGAARNWEASPMPPHFRHRP